MATHSSTLTWKNPMDGGAWWAAVHGVAKSRTRLSDFTFTFHLHALEKEMATHSSALAWRIPGTGEPGGLPSVGSQSRTRLKRLSSSSSSSSRASVMAVAVFGDVLIKSLRYVSVLQSIFSVVQWGSEQVFSVRSTFSPSFYYFPLTLVIGVDSSCRGPTAGFQEHCGW